MIAKDPSSSPHACPISTLLTVTFPALQVSDSGLYHVFPRSDIDPILQS